MKRRKNYAQYLCAVRLDGTANRIFTFASAKDRAGFMRDAKKVYGKAVEFATSKAKERRNPETSSSDDYVIAVQKPRRKAIEFLGKNRSLTIFAPDVLHFHKEAADQLLVQFKKAWPKWKVSAEPYASVEAGARDDAMLKLRYGTRNNPSLRIKCRGSRHLFYPGEIGKRMTCPECGKTFKMTSRNTNRTSTVGLVGVVPPHNEASSGI
jgi:hypothetical protein